MKTALGIATPLQQAEETLLILRKLQLLEKGLEFSRTEAEILIPILHKPTERDFQAIKERSPSARIQQAIFREVKSRSGSLLESVRGKIPESYLSNLPRSLDIVGDIAIIELPDELIQFSSIIGSTLMDANPHVRLVVRKSGEVSGRFRTRRFEKIAGSGSTQTFHREHSCTFHLDIAKVYFNARLAHERMRVAEQVRPRETVVDMFAGVGPYSVLIAKTQPTSRVYAIDINQEAFRYLKENILTNRIADRVTPIFGDAREVTASILQATASRVIMNLPSESMNFLDAAIKALAPVGGVVHYYTFASRFDSLDTIKASVRSIVESRGRRIHSYPFCKIIREIAPNRVQVAIDLEVK